MFQNNSEFQEVLDGQYKLFMSNSNAFGDINITMGLQSSTPEIKATDRQANLLGHVDITRADVSVSQGVKIHNPDNNGQISMSVNKAKN